jgi:hypothetical protein
LLIGFAKFLPLIETVGRLLLGNDHQLPQVISCLLAGVHLLIEDRPGMRIDLG